MDPAVNRIRRLFVGVDKMINPLTWIKNWWADDWHIVPRWTRDIIQWLKGSQSSRVDLHTLTWDPEKEEVHDDVIRVRRKDLPPEALHRSGRGRAEYVRDLDGAGPWPKVGEATAGDLFLFAQTDAYDLNEIFKKRNGFGIDVRMLGIVLGAIGLVVVVWVVYKWVL